MENRDIMERKLTGKCHGSRLFARVEDKEKTRRLFKRFDICGITPTCTVTFEKEPWYHYCYSNVLNAESRMLTFYIELKVKRKIEAAIDGKLNPGDRGLLQINDCCIAIVNLSKHYKGLVFTVAEKKIKDYRIKIHPTAQFKLLRVAKYGNLADNLVEDYVRGESVPELESKYPISKETIGKILREKSIHIRSISEQRVIKHHGRLPSIKDVLSEEKLKIIFAILGDNIGNVESKGYGIGVIGDLYFTEAFADAFENEYNIRPVVRKDKTVEAFKARLKNKNIFNDLRKYAQLGAHTWKLLDNTSECIEKMDCAELGRAVSYYWEAEGCVQIDNKTIEATSVNHRGLLQIQKVMNILQIKTSITGPNYAASSNGLYTIRVSGRDNIKAFNEKVSFVSQRKKNDVEKLLSSYKRFVKIHTFEEYENAFNLKKKGFTVKETATTLGISASTLKAWFYEDVKPRVPT